MQAHSRVALSCMLVLGSAWCAERSAASEADPGLNRPVRMILGFAGGGGDDYLARMIAPRLTERLGQSVIVDNRPGAGSTLAAELTARAAPDGHTMMLGSSTPLASAVNLYPKLGYDLVASFSHVSRVAASGNVLLVHPALPARSVGEFLALARSKPKTMTYGSAGVASVAHLAMELLQTVAGIQLSHIPYKGGGQVVVALTGGEVPVAFSSVAAALPMLQTKRLHALAVSTRQRTSALPDVPTIAESGFPAFDVTNTFGILAPADLPPALLKRLNAEIRRIVEVDEIRSKAAVQAIETMGSTPDEYREILRAEVAQWERVIRNARITLQ